MVNASVCVYGGLRCRVFDALSSGVAPDRLVVLAHGFGAPGDDLAGLGPHLLEAAGPENSRCRYVFPEAPIDLTSMGIPGGRAWWPLSMNMLAELNQTHDFSILTTLKPDGLVQASEQLLRTIREAQQDCGLTDAETIIGGFSQGAMTCTDVVLRYGLQPAALVLFSGCLLTSDEWRKFADDHPGCRVLQSHGRNDTVLPFEPAESLRDLLQGAGFAVEFLPFNGPHTIPSAALVRLQQFL